MQQYSKATAAVIAGAVVTMIIAIAKVYAAQLATVLQEPGVQAALQTVITAVAVDFAPPNNG
jgi:hypothetical protein